MICHLFPEPTLFLFSADVPDLLYYSHIPAIVVALVVGLFVYLNGREFLVNRLLLVIAGLFSLWTLCNLILWTNINSDVLLIAWTLYSALFTFISVFAVYLTYVFVQQHDATERMKYILFGLVVPAVVFGPTSFNLGGLDLTNCDAFMFEGFWYKVYYVSISAIAMLWILALLIEGYKKASVDFRKQIAYFGVGIEFFLFSFFTIVFLGTYIVNIGLSDDSRIEFYGLFGMLFFMAFIATIIVRFKAFHVGMIAAQALVVALILLIGSMFTFANEFINVVLISITLLITCVIGFLLIRNVKREIQQRELIQAQEKELEVANKQQEGLLHFISHEVKGYLTESEAGFAAIAEGDYGETAPKLKEMSKNALASVRRGVRTVMEILDASNLKKGTVSYKKNRFDLKAAVLDVVEHQKKYAAEKGLEIQVSIGDGTYTMEGDEEKVRQHVIRNLIDNAIKYTPHGTVRVELKDGAKLRFAVSDSGVGVTPEDMKNLFTEGGKGKDSMKVNVHSTGYGLYIAKSIVEAHGGKIWAESEGQGKGSTFIVEFLTR